MSYYDSRNDPEWTKKKHNNSYDHNNFDFDPIGDFDKVIYAYILLLLILIAMICPIGVSFYFITLFTHPVVFSDYMSLIIGAISMIVTLYFGILYQLSNFHNIVKWVEKICKVDLKK